MLIRARRKAPHVAWVQGGGAALPFRAGSFDFAYIQSAFHHIEDKAGMLRAALRVLRPQSRFSLHNMCPEQSPDRLYYEYFPGSRLADLQDYWPSDRALQSIKEIGFAGVATAYRHLHWEQNMPAWLDTVRRRDTCSQLQAIPDAAYRAGVERLKRDIADPRMPRSRQDHLCLVTIRGTVSELARNRLP